MQDLTLILDSSMNSPMVFQLAIRICFSIYVHKLAFLESLDQS